MRLGNIKLSMRLNKLTRLLLLCLAFFSSGLVAQERKLSLSSNDNELSSKLLENFKNKLLPLNLTNSFFGTLNSSGKDLPAVTSFYIKNDGNIVGEYVFYEGSDGQYSGDLYNCNIMDIETLRCTWKDIWGEGIFQIIFSEDFNSFSGFWSDYSRIDLKLNWNGRR